MTNAIHNGVVPVFDFDNLNLKDLLVCEGKVESIGRIILSYLHVLEDCEKIDAIELVKIAKQLQLWRKERRYWRHLQDLKDCWNLETTPERIVRWLDNAKVRQGRWATEAKQFRANFTNKAVDDGDSGCKLVAA